MSFNQLTSYLCSLLVSLDIRIHAHIHKLKITIGTTKPTKKIANNFETSTN